MNPEILLADEPTGSLDAGLISEVIALFRNLNNQGETVIIVTHNPDVSSKCDRVYNLKDGRLEK